jgi:hypothetical protein
MEYWNQITYKYDSSIINEQARIRQIEK